MKKFLALLLTCIVPLSMLAACSSETEEKTVISSSGTTETVKEEDPVELTVFAAASMTETLEEIAELYKETAPNVTLVYNFDSSGTLKTQIEEGADCDIFISAATKQMDQLDSSKDTEVNPDALDFVLQGTRLDLLENKVALAVPKDNPKDIKSYDDLAAGLKDGSIMFAMGNADVYTGKNMDN